jgi:uncharacterized membrane protein YhhN
MHKVLCDYLLEKKNAKLFLIGAKSFLVAQKIKFVSS